MIIAIGSKNKVKIQATEKACKDRLQGDLIFKSIGVPSGVPDQPFDDDIQKGAKNRAIGACRYFDADLGIGLEGGITTHQGGYYEYAWCAIADKSGQVVYGHSFGIPMPPVLMKKISEGKELGIALDELLDIKNTREKEGFFGFATGNRITRETGYYAMICAALAPISLKKYYGEETK